MASNTIRMDAGRLNRGITMNVVLTGMRTVRARWWLACQVLRLAALIAGCRIHVEVPRHD